MTQRSWFEGFFTNGPGHVILSGTPSATSAAAIAEGVAQLAAKTNCKAPLDPLSIASSKNNDSCDSCGDNAITNLPLLSPSSDLPEPKSRDETLMLTEPHIMASLDHLPESSSSSTSSTVMFASAVAVVAITTTTSSTAASSPSSTSSSSSSSSSSKPVSSTSTSSPTTSCITTLSNIFATNTIPACSSSSSSFNYSSLTFSPVSSPPVSPPTQALQPSRPPATVINRHLLASQLSGPGHTHQRQHHYHNNPTQQQPHSQSHQCSPNSVQQYQIGSGQTCAATPIATTSSVAATVATSASLFRNHVSGTGVRMTGLTHVSNNDAVPTARSSSPSSVSSITNSLGAAILPPPEDTSHVVMIKGRALNRLKAELVQVTCL
ncbi:unnamed protein product [Protopolystoma xenopodis]|uniref:Uncharacterized protein n=1 Tax=Protopolystoma xenopodis TaxID=117903 RepID=A0A448WFZ4_9PLAT|nr:unnamed protein product [Protopolystoma xenopodis]